MSGFLSALATLVSFLDTPKYIQVLSILIAVVTLLIAVFITWQRKQSEVLELQEKIRPKLKISFGMTVPGCIKLAPNSSSPDVKTFRLKVETDNVSRVEGCCGVLLSITSSRSTFNSDTIQLTFNRAEDTDCTNKTIHSGVPEFLDLLAIFTEYNRPKIHSKDFITPNDFDEDRFFKPHDEYIFEIAIKSKDSITQKYKIKLVWLGDWRNATMEPVN